MINKLLTLLLLLFLFQSCKENIIENEIELELVKNIEPNRIIITNSGSISIYDPYYESGVLLLKGQMHCHTTNSDGKLSPNELSDYYDSLNYDFFTITDHNYITSKPSNTSLIWMGDSYEFTNWKKFHSVIYNTHSVVKNIGRFDSLYNISKNISKNTLVSYAHPMWVGLPQTDSSFQYIKKTDFIEISGYNKKNYFNTYAADLLLSNKIHVFILTVDDFHSRSQKYDSWIDVVCNKYTKDDIWKSILKGNFYCSNGAYMACKVNEMGLLTVSTPIQSLIKIIGKQGKEIVSLNNVTNLEYQIAGDEGYIRCEVIDENGKICWSQAIIIF